MGSNNASVTTATVHGRVPVVHFARFARFGEQRHALLFLRALFFRFAKMAGKMLLGGSLLFCFSGCQNEDDKAWAAVKGHFNLEEIDRFLAERPESEHRAEALVEREEALWRKALSEATVWNYLQYVQEYPQGTHSAKVFEAVPALSVAFFSVAELTASPFNGLLGKDSTAQHIRLDFKEIQERADTLRFTVVLNLSQVRNTLTGFLVRADNAVHFDRSLDLPGMLIRTPGRLYRHEGRLLLESTDLEQYWRVGQ